MKSRTVAPALRARGRVFLAAVVLLASGVTAVVGSSAPVGATTTPAPSPAGTAISSTAPTAGASANGAVLPFSELGLPQSYSFASGSTSVTIQLPVPELLKPTELYGTLLIPPGFGTGSLVASSGTKYLGSYSLPASSAQQQRVSFGLPIVGGAVQGAGMSITVQLEQIGAGPRGVTPSSTCQSALPLELVDPVVQYSGSYAEPTSIASFFPAVADQVTLYTPPTPTPAEEQAALDLAAVVAHSYRLVPVQVQVASWSGAGLPPEPTGALDRAIVIRQSSSTGLALPDVQGQSRILVLQGTPTTLPQQATILASDVAKVLQVRSASVVRSFTPPVLGQTSFTFSQLGLSGSATFSGQTQFSLPIPQPKLGGVVTSITTKLLANYTPVGGGAGGSVVVSAGGVQLAQASLNSGGLAELDFTIPSYLIARTTDLNVTASYFPVGFRCGSGNRTITFSVSPASTLHVVTATGGTGGFPNLPQSLLPVLQVAFDHPSAQRLGAAVSTLCGLQRMSPTVLHTRVVPFATAVHDGSPVLVVADAHTVKPYFHAPIQYLGNDTYRVHTASHGTFTMHGGVGAIQSLNDTTHHRTALLVTTSGSWSLVASLFSWLGNGATRWSSLTGDVLMTGTHGHPVNITVRAGGPRTLTASTPTSQKLYLAIAAVFFVALVLIGLWATVRWRRRRRRASSQEPAATEVPGPGGDHSGD